LALLGSDAPHVFDLLLDVPDAPRNLPPIGFELRFTRAACADATSQLRHLDAMTCEAWQHVVQLRQFDLQLAFSRARVARKNVEDQLGAIDDSPLDDLFNIALLGRAEIVVEQENVGIHRGCRAGDFFKFARADQGRWIGPVASLQDLAHNVGPGTLG
jgi:hypothetical protein